MKRPDDFFSIENIRKIKAQNKNLTLRKHQKTHCIKGHALTPDNVYLEASGNFRCKTCFKEWEDKRSVAHAAYSRARRSLDK